MRQPYDPEEGAKPAPYKHNPDKFGWGDGDLRQIDPKPSEPPEPPKPDDDF